MSSVSGDDHLASPRPHAPLVSHRRTRQADCAVLARHTRPTAFDALPTAARNRVGGRLWELLAKKCRSQTERDAIISIVRATKKGLPEVWTDSQ
ncbi:MAG: hypothetical protein ABGZ35_00520 [Planctomycetaceae bacterium]